MRQLLAINLQVRCADGSVHDSVKLYVEDNRRIYVAEDDAELTGIECIAQCTAVVSPIVLAKVLHACKECE
ncbi:hypothetical protein EBT31_02515 [bacterium]|nr:hypothetical protein [bacterium]